MTAVEWYFKRMQSKEHFTQDEFDGIYEQAKEMEKQQIVKAYWVGCSDWDNDKEAERYYNETFKKL